MIFGPSLLLLKRKFFVSPISAEMMRLLKCHNLKNFKNFISMPKNFLMIVDITGVAALSCAIYIILRYSYFQVTFSFQGCSIKKKLMRNIYGSYF